MTAKTYMEANTDTTAKTETKVNTINIKNAANIIKRDDSAAPSDTLKKSDNPVRENNVGNDQPILVKWMTEEKGQNQEIHNIPLNNNQDYKSKISDSQKAEDETTLSCNDQAKKHVKPISLHEDKWKQLYHVYPHVTPFQDDREYLSIGPNDFVILNKTYHKLVNNSFLLHGFYNYEHLILARVVRRGEERYYLGVPGNYYEREKQVAVMFGFESFECQKEPAREGDFGYYMIRVEI